LSFGNKGQEMLVAKAPRKSQRIRKSDVSNDYKVYISEIQMKGNPT
jgi:hypothetical protein